MANMARMVSPGGFPSRLLGGISIPINDNKTHARMRVEGLGEEKPPLNGRPSAAVAAAARGQAGLFAAVSLVSAFAAI